MNKERSRLLTLLDLSAFAYSQNPGAKTRQGLAEACLLAERCALPETEFYRYLMRRLDQEISEMETPDLADRFRRFSDSLSP